MIYGTRIRFTPPSTRSARAQRQAIQLRSASRNHRFIREMFRCARGTKPRKVPSRRRRACATWLAISRHCSPGTLACSTPRSPLARDALCSPWISPPCSKRTTPRPDTMRGTTSSTATPARATRETRRFRERWRTPASGTSCTAFWISRSRAAGAVCLPRRVGGRFAGSPLTAATARRRRWSSKSPHTLRTSRGSSGSDCSARRARRAATTTQTAV
mmetsp:Transcript_12621/g.52917  ORF Transcript_12621/g.52917 Transcript_12621/m.52917 type:complete len:216 (-) Transcript_12621:2345-2992(-)